MGRQTLIWMHTILCQGSFKGARKMKASTLHYVFHWAGILNAVIWIKYVDYWSLILTAIFWIVATIFKELEE